MGAAILVPLLLHLFGEATAEPDKEQVVVVFVLKKLRKNKSNGKG